MPVHRFSSSCVSRSDRADSWRSSPSTRPVTDAVGAPGADHHHRAGSLRHASHIATISACGVWMGEPLNGSGDLLAPHAMYEASRLIAGHVRWLGGQVHLVDPQPARLHRRQAHHGQPQRLGRCRSAHPRHPLASGHIVEVPVRSGPRRVRFEDFVQRQDETLARLESYLGVTLARIPVKPEAVGRWKTDTGPKLLRLLRTRDGAVRV